MSEGSSGFETRLSRAVASLGKDDANLTREERKDVSMLEERTSEAPESLAHISEIQSDKRDFVRGYHEWRKKFWKTDDALGTERSQALEHIASFEQYDGALELRKNPDGTFETTLEGGKRISLTKGHIFAAREWGVWWKMGDTIPREMQLGIMSHQVRGVLKDRYDDQIIEFGCTNNRNSEGKRNMYRRIKEERTLRLADTRPGIIAERMLFSALTKAMYDRPDLRFRIESPSAFKDIEESIDFVVIIESGARGVKVGEPDQRIGVQFTIDTRIETQERKASQVEQRNRRLTEESPIDEVVLVTLPIDHVKRYVHEWHTTSSGREKRKCQLDPRGPDHNWPKTLHEQVIDELVRKVVARTRSEMREAR